MKLTEKDRAQLLRMAGNIAGNICDSTLPEGEVWKHMVANYSASMALATMQAVDRLIEGEAINATMDE